MAKARLTPSIDGTRSGHDETSGTIGSGKPLGISAMSFTTATSQRASAIVPSGGGDPGGERNHREVEQAAQPEACVEQHEGRGVEARDRIRQRVAAEAGAFIRRAR